MQAPYDTNGNPLDFSNRPFCKDVVWYKINPRKYFQMPVLTYYTPYVVHNPKDPVYQMIDEYLHPCFCYGFAESTVTPGPFRDITGTAVFVDVRDNSVPFMDDINTSNSLMGIEELPWCKFSAHKYDTQSWFNQVREAILLADRYHKWITGMEPKKPYLDEVEYTAWMIQENDVDRHAFDLTDDHIDQHKRDMQRLYGGERVTQIDFMEFSWFLQTIIEDREREQYESIHRLEEELQEARDTYATDLKRNRHLF